MLVSNRILSNQCIEDSEDDFCSIWGRYPGHTNTPGGHPKTQRKCVVSILGHDVNLHFDRILRFLETGKRVASTATQTKSGCVHFQIQAPPVRDSAVAKCGSNAFPELALRK